MALGGQGQGRALFPMGSCDWSGDNLFHLKPCQDRFDHFGNASPNVEVVQTLEIFQVTPFIWNLNSPREMIPHNHNMFKCSFVPNEYRSLGGLWNLHESNRSEIWWKGPSGSFKSLPPRYTCPPTCFQIACSQTHNPTHWHTISTPLPGCHEKYHALGARGWVHKLEVDYGMMLVTTTLM